MLIKGMKLPESRRVPVNGLRVPFETLAVGDAWQVDMKNNDSKDAYNLLKVRVYRASNGNRKFVTRKIDGEVFVFRTA